MKGKALSVQSPWAWFIIHKNKTHENRTWSTDYRGPLYIHVSKKINREAFDFFKEQLQDMMPDLKDFRTGGLIGKVDLVDVVTESDSPWFEGPYGFMLKNPEPIEFVPMRGQLGIFNFETKE